MTIEELYEKYYYSFIDNEKEIKIFEEHGLEFPRYEEFLAMKKGLDSFDPKRHGCMHLIDNFFAYEFPKYDILDTYITNGFIRWCINRILDLTKKFVPEIIDSIPDEILDNIEELYKFTKYGIFDTLSCLPNTQMDSHTLNVIYRPIYYYSYHIFEESVDYYVKTQL
jgi:hypothetical protein